MLDWKISEDDGNNTEITLCLPCGETWYITCRKDYGCFVVESVDAGSNTLEKQHIAKSLIKAKQHIKEYLLNESKTMLTDLYEEITIYQDFIREMENLSVMKEIECVDLANDNPIFAEKFSGNFICFLAKYDIDVTNLQHHHVKSVLQLDKIIGYPYPYYVLRKYEDGDELGEPAKTSSCLRDIKDRDLKLHEFSGRFLCDTYVFDFKQDKEITDDMEIEEKK